MELTCGQKSMWRGLKNSKKKVCGESYKLYTALTSPGLRKAVG